MTQSPLSTSNPVQIACHITSLDADHAAPALTADGSTLVIPDPYPVKTTGKQVYPYDNCFPAGQNETVTTLNIDTLALGSSLTGGISGDYREHHNHLGGGELHRPVTLALCALDRLIHAEIGMTLPNDIWQFTPETDPPVREGMVAAAVHNSWLAQVLSLDSSTDADEGCNE